VSRPDTTWMADGACLGLPPGTMRPTDGDGERRAKAVCATCPVRTTCLQHALDADEQYGVWGGCTEGERRAIATGQPLPVYGPTPIDHGTTSGYHKHRKRGVPMCIECLDAYNEERRNARRIARQEVAA
jgi:WhiB family redox-sensing transcriptional regulator